MRNNKLLKSFAVLSTAFMSTLLMSITASASSATQANIELRNKSYAITQVDSYSYLNIRTSPSLEGEVVGKLNNNGVATIIEDGEWIKIQSGAIEGYVSSEYVLTGEEAKTLADQVSKKYGVVQAITLRLREKADANSRTFDLIGQDEKLEIIGTEGDWTKVRFNDIEGYVSTDYINEHIEYEYAEPIEEASKPVANNNKVTTTSKPVSNNNKVTTTGKPAVNKTTATTTSKPAVNKNNTTTTSKPATNKNNTTVTKKPATNSNTSTKSGATGQDVVAYAKQFLGNPYVYGGTSLTNGTDCSGFVQGVYKKFGISLPRTSSQQGKAGKKVNRIKNAQLGDLIYYSGHIGIYVGNGKIIHASNPEGGIKYSNATYAPILSIRRII